MHMPCNICTRTFIPKWNQHDWITEPKLKHLVNGNWPNKEIQKLQQFFFFWKSPATSGAGFDRSTPICQRIANQ